jgi:hypothetical protein
MATLTLTPEFVTLGDPAESIHDPAVAPDQSSIVFDYGKVKGGLGRFRLDVSHRQELDGSSQQRDISCTGDLPRSKRITSKHARSSRR